MRARAPSTCAATVFTQATALLALKQTKKIPSKNKTHLDPRQAGAQRCISGSLCLLQVDGPDLSRQLSPQLMRSSEAGRELAGCPAVCSSAGKSQKGQNTMNKDSFMTRSTEAGGKHAGFSPTHSSAGETINLIRKAQTARQHLLNHCYWSVQYRRYTGCPTHCAQGMGIYSLFHQPMAI